MSALPQALVGNLDEALKFASYALEDGAFDLNDFDFDGIDPIVARSVYNGLHVEEETDRTLKTAAVLAGGRGTKIFSKANPRVVSMTKLAEFTHKLRDDLGVIQQLTQSDKLLKFLTVDKISQIFPEYMCSGSARGAKAGDAFALSNFRSNPYCLSKGYVTRAEFDNAVEDFCAVALSKNAAAADGFRRMKEVQADKCASWNPLCDDASAMGVYAVVAAAAPRAGGKVLVPRP